jgi:hypothetical protein
VVILSQSLDTLQIIECAGLTERLQATETTIERLRKPSANANANDNDNDNGGCAAYRSSSNQNDLTDGDTSGDEQQTHAPPHHHHQSESDEPLDSNDLNNFAPPSALNQLISIEYNDYPSCLAWNSNNGYLAAALGRHIVIFAPSTDSSTSKWQPIMQIRADFTIRSLAWSASENRLLVCGKMLVLVAIKRVRREIQEDPSSAWRKKKQVVQYDMVSTMLWRSASTTEVYISAFSPDGRYFCTAGMRETETETETERVRL